MKLVLTLEQYKNILSKLLFEDDSEIRLDQDVNLSSVDSLKDFKNKVKTIGYQHSETSKSRKLGKDISGLLSDIEKLEDKDVFEKYFIKIAELISIYKKGSFSLKKLSQIIDNLVKKDINVAKEQIEQIISIFEDKRFEEKYKKKLISILTGVAPIDLDSFYRETKKVYDEYQKSFAEGPLSPFLVHQTIPEISVSLASDFIYNKMTISKDEFNSQKSDISKVLYLIQTMSKAKFYSSANDFIKNVMLNLNFDIYFNYSEDNIKADLKLKEALVYEDRATKKVNYIGSVNSYVEVKHKLYKTPDFISEFFKIDSTDKNYNLLLDAISKIPNVVNPSETLKLFLEAMVMNLYHTMNKGDGKNIINHLIKDMSGMIFKDNIFVRKEDIVFYWNTIGYAKRPRLSIFYNVNPSAKLYQLHKTNDGFNRFVDLINK
jgi:hypothetical protein